MPKRNRNAMYPALGVILLVIAFILDLHTPLGVSDGLLYLPIIILSVFLQDLLLTCIAACIATLFIVLGYYNSPTYGCIPQVVFTNHVFSGFTIWVTVLLIFLYQRSQQNAALYREHLYSLFSKVDEAIVIVNNKGEIVLSNPKTVELFKYTPEEINQLHFYDLLPLRITNENMEVEAPNKITDPVWFSGSELTFNARKKNADMFPVMVHAWVFEYLNLKYHTLFIIDNTEKERQKKELLKANNYLTELSNELSATNEGLEEKIRQRTSELSTAVDRLKHLNHSLHQEIMDKEEAVVALNASQLMLETIATNFPNGILSVLDRNFKYIYVHGQEIQNLGFTQKVLLGTLFLPMRNEDSKQEIAELLHKVFTGQSVTFEFLNKQFGNYYMFNAAPLPSLTGETEEILIVSQNISVRKKAENDILASLEKEKELNEMKSRFVTNASHEFKTPLATILTSASLLEKYNNTEDTPKRQKHITRIVSSVNNLTEILNNFLSLGRIEQGKICNNPSPFDIADLFNDLLDEFTPQTKTNQELKLICNTDESTVCLDKNLLRNILANLISNAIKYSGTETEITVQVQKKENEFLVSVTDRGIGIPLDEQKLMFNSFSRASNAENIKGTGIGLHLVKKYLEVMQGTIELKSELNKGSCFNLHFRL